MQLFQFIVFLGSAIALPFLVSRAVNAKLTFIGRMIVFLILLVSARYLLGATWVPASIWALRTKAVIVSLCGWMCWWAISWALMSRKVRAWTVFVSYMLLPFVVCFAFCPGSIATGGLYVGNGAWWSIGSGFESRLAKATFWGGWVILSWLYTFNARASKTSRTLLSLVAVLAVAFFMSSDIRRCVVEAGKDVVTTIRENVARRWPVINKQTENIVSAWEIAIEKDRQLVAGGVIGTGKLRAVANIEEDIRKLRSDLLPLDSQAVLSDVNKMDSDIESSRRALSALRERRFLSPEMSESLDAAIKKEEARLANLEAERANAVEKVRGDLKAIGIELPEGSVFMTVDLGDIIDNAIVAKGIGIVVENLKNLMEAGKGDTEAAKRYYGAYVVMLDVQSECFRQYLVKAKSGIWHDGVRDIARVAEAAKAKNEAKAAAAGVTEFEKKAFLHSAATNEKTLRAAKAYIAILDKHSEIIQQKLDAAERMHGVALSFWESADIASSFGARISSDLAEFEALLELKLPEIVFMDDMAMQAEFESITHKLRKE